MKDDTKYWNSYYKKAFIEEASPFAIFCHQNIFDRPLRIVEFGSGSGRDLRYLHHAGHHITGFDTSEEAVSHIRTSFPDLHIERADFTVLEPMGEIEAVYSRWTLHSVDDESAGRALTWCAENLSPSGLLLIEVRTVNDHLFGSGEPAGRNAFMTDHYRRFIVPEELEQELEGLGFDIVHFEEGQGFSVYKGDDPVLLRVVARR